MPLPLCFFSNSPSLIRRPALHSLPIDLSPLRPSFKMSAVSVSPRQTQTLFKLHKTVMPADSDYSSSLWHGAYIRYLEEARVQYLAHVHLPYSQLVADYNTELVVIELNIQYKKPAKLGEKVYITIGLAESASKLKIPIESDVVRESDGQLLASATVTLVPVSADSGKVRKWPSVLEEALKSALPNRSK